MSDLSQTTERAAKRYIRRLDRLVVTLLGLRFTSPDGIWTLQLDLRSLQRDIQAEIAAIKRLRRSADRTKALERLHEVLWHARRFGDALAWLLLHGDRQLIYPLAENQRVPVPPDDHSTRGLDAIAAHLASTGLGYPLLHDVTDLLRIGDVTFIKPGEPAITAEVKTRVVSSRPSETGTVYEYRIELILGDEVVPARMRSDSPPSGEAPRNPHPDGAPRRRSRINARTGRQLQRLRRAHKIKVAEHGALIEEGDRPTLSLVMSRPGRPGHWKLLRRLAREARRDGYASGTAEGAIMFAAFYERPGEKLSGSQPSLDRLPSDLTSSGILWTDPADIWRNSLTIQHIPDHRGDGPHRYMPYFLYPLPRWAVRDILRGRLGFVAMLNLGRLAAEIEARGLTVEMPRSDAEYMQTPMWVSRVVELPDGTLMRAGIGGLHLHLMEMLMEGQSLDYFVDMVVAMADAAAEHAPMLAVEQADD